MSGYREDDYYDDRDEGYRATSHCSRFSRRGDMTVFSMSTYQSCENCRHMTADSRCILNMDHHFPGEMI